MCSIEIHHWHRLQGSNRITAKYSMHARLCFAFYSYLVTKILLFLMAIGNTYTMYQNKMLSGRLHVFTTHHYPLCILLHLWYTYPTIEMLQNPVSQFLWRNFVTNITHILLIAVKNNNSRAHIPHIPGRHSDITLASIKTCDVITYPCSNLSDTGSCAMRSYIQHKTIHVTIYRW